MKSGKQTEYKKAESSCFQDGLAGWCDRSMQLCLGLALWNGKDGNRGLKIQRLETCSDINNTKGIDATCCELIYELLL